MNTSSPFPSSSPSRRSVLRTATFGAVVAAAGLAPAGGAFAARRTPDTYSLTITHLDRAGRPTGAYATTVSGLSGPGAEESVKPYDPSGTVTVRLPRGRYVLDSVLTAGGDGGGTDWIVRPRLDLDRDTTVTVDARTARPVDVRPPARTAAFLHGGMFLRITHDGAERFLNQVVDAPTLRVAHLGPAAEPGAVRQWYDAYWSAGSVRYALGHTGTSARALTGLTVHPSPPQLATLLVHGGAPQGAPGTATVDLLPSEGPTVGLSRPLATPGTATYLVTPERGTWDVVYTVRPSTPEAPPVSHRAEGIRVRAGATTTRSFDDATRL
ncbi:hypothetical protein ACF09C_28180 [Streptomyces sp. NPDC014870]|uniref:hypothetical protein n=1 Tax=Streptomyces sp. NPDC014870 TaxID=3364925 RepID=UPI003700F052